MKVRHYLFLGLLVVLALSPAFGYVEERFTLQRIVHESSNILVVQVEKVNKERKLIYYKKILDLKGKHPADFVKHNVGVGGFNELEQKIPIEWAEPGKIAIMFYNGGASETCIGRYWYQAYAGGEWWNHSHGEPYLRRSYCGDIKELQAAVEKLLKGEEVIIPVTVSKTDLRIQKVRANPKNLADYPIVEGPAIERTKLTDVVGFSEMIELPRPEGQVQGAIPVDFDGDGWLDLLLVGTERLVLLRNNQKGNFDDVTDKWGMASAPGCRAAALADYNRTGRPSLLTSSGKLYTNQGDKFTDDSKLLPATPERVGNPGEAFAWADIDGDGLPDILLSVGVRGLTAYRNLGGKEGKWFEDVSAKVGLGPDGLGQEASNFLTALDLTGDGKHGFVLNLEHALVVHNKGGAFVLAKDSGISFPALPRPALASADFLNDGRLGLFVTTNERQGSLRDWLMLGTFSEEEDKKLPEPAKLNPEAHPLVKMGDDSWRWTPVKAKASGVLEVGRRQPTPNAAYAHATFDWPRGEKIALHIGSDNKVKVWLNGKDVFTQDARKAFVADADSVEVDVVQGTNSILLKAFDEGPFFRVSVRPAAKNLYPPPAVQLYVRQQDGKFADVTAQAGDLGQLRAECISATWCDLDNDGLQDLLVIARNGMVRYYHNLGAGKFRYATPELGLEQKFKATGAVAADFNKDGLLDLVLIGQEPDPCVALISKLKGKKTPVTIDYRGPQPLTGARATVIDKAGKLLASQIISGGEGRNLQSTAQPRFALDMGTYTLRLRFSNGQEVTQDVDVGEQAQWVQMGKK